MRREFDPRLASLLLLLRWWLDVPAPTGSGHHTSPASHPWRRAAGVRPKRDPSLRTKTGGIVL